MAAGAHIHTENFGAHTIRILAALDEQVCGRWSGTMVAM